MWNDATAAVGVIYQQLKFNTKRTMRDTKVLKSANPLQSDLDPDDLQHDFCTGLADLHPDLNADPNKCVPASQLQSNWLNSEPTQRALNAFRENIPHWEVCNSSLNQTISYKPVNDVLGELFGANLKLLY